MVNLDICSKTDVGRVRTTNEDSLLVVPLGTVHILAVADGLGGHAAGEVASRIALIEIEEFLKANLAGNNLREAIGGAVAKANKEIWLLSKENAAYEGMGSTLVLAIVSGDKALIANVGDSRAYLMGDGVRQVTKDHSLVRELVDRGVISEEQAVGHPQKNIVTRSLGAKEEVVPDFYDWELSGNTLLLCSDGLTDTLSENEIIETIVASADLDEACSRLIDLANRKGATDNITVILARERRQGA
jgi:protein phosphatase